MTDCKWVIRMPLWLTGITRRELHDELGAAMSELNEQLTSISTQLGEISAQQTKGYDEVTKLITDLKATTPDNSEALALADQIQAKVDTLAGQTQQLDDVVPDQPAPETPTE